jgi:hypothetical protein
MSVPHTKADPTVLRPSEDVDVISSTPGHRGDDLFDNLGHQPLHHLGAGALVIRSDVRVGSSMLGSMSICSRLSETAPRMTRIRVTMVVKIGRFDAETGKVHGVHLFPVCGSVILLGGYDDGGAVVQQLLSQGDHPAGQPLRFHLDPAALADSHCNAAPDRPIAHPG